MTEVAVKKENLTLERIGLLAVVGLLSWNVYTTNQLTIAQAVTQEQLNSVSIQIVQNNTASVKQSEFIKEVTKVQSTLDRHESWIARLSERLNEVEEDHARESTR